MTDDVSGIIYLFSFIGIAGIFCMLLSAHQIWMGLQTHKWTEVRGIIRENKSSSYENIPLAVRGIGIGNAPSYAFCVRYDYVTDGAIFTGKRIHYGMRNLNKKEELLAFLAEFDVGNGVSVFVDPKKPGRSVLVPGVSSASVGLLTLGIVTTLVGGVIYYYIS